MLRHFSKIATYAAALAAAGSLLAGAANAESRVALVIGNSNYAHAPHLANPANDADMIATSLTRAGFKVVERKNLGDEAMRNTIFDFSHLAQNADVAVVYYAGHGIQVDGANYLVPVDATLNSPASLSFEAIQAGDVLTAVSQAHHLRLLILDACRENPFKAQLSATGTRGVANRGLAPIATDGTNDTVVAYAAKDDTVALDGNGANSPYASALSKRMNEKGTELGKMFGEVRDDVIKTTGGQQIPYVYNSRGGSEFYFMPVNTVINNSNVQIVTGVDPRAIELAFWQSVATSNDEAEYQAYLNKYPNGEFAVLAHAKIAILKKGQLPPVQPGQSSQPVQTSQPSSSHPAQVASLPPGRRPVFVPEVQHAIDAARDAERDAQAKAISARAAAKHAEEAAKRAQAKQPGTRVWTATDGVPGYHYEGEASANGDITGYGVGVWPNGQRFEGHYDNSRMSGVGVITWSSGERYEGEESDNKKQGVGLRFGGPAHIYSKEAGDFGNDEINGYCVVYWNDGTVSIGNWKDARMNGYGAKLDARGNPIEQGYYEADTLKTAMTP